MDIEQLVRNTAKAIINLIHTVVPDLSLEAIRLGAASVLGIAALWMLISALRLLKPAMKNKRIASERVNIPRTIQREGLTIDILNSSEEDDVAVRCVLTSVASNKLKCEIIERLDTIKTKEGKEVMCVFAPMKNENGKINTFTATLLETDTSGKKLDQIVLSVPDSYGLTPRRKHTRKRVADQQFLRVKMWVDNPYSSDISFEDAAPHIGVNSFTTEDPAHASNAVINISNGGVGLSIKNQVIPETCATGAVVGLNLFMFNFREKTFKPYWYVGEIRSMEEGRPGFTRMGIEFTGTGESCEETGRIRWKQLEG